MKHYLFYLLIPILMFTKVSFSQEIESREQHYQHQLNFGTDNDFFAVLTNKDRSYTFGVNAAYRFIPEEENFVSKIFSTKKAFLHDVSIHMEAYTPNYDFDTGIPTGERPFAGWTYATLATQYIFDQSFIVFKTDIGVLGEISQGGAIQDWFHSKVSGDTVLQGWEDQIPNQLGVNLKMDYFRSIHRNGWYDFFGSVEASLGNVRSYVFPKLYVRIGEFNEITKTTSLNNSLFQSKKDIEYYIQASLGFKAIANDATLQGNIFSNSNDTRTLDHIDHTTIHANFGGFAAYQRFNLGVLYHFNSGEIDSIKTHSYVSINLDYKF